eukprot:5628577-Prymnesium_polylepis.1
MRMILVSSRTVLADNGREGECSQTKVKKKTGNHGPIPTSTLGALAEAHAEVPYDAAPPRGAV